MAISERHIYQRRPINCSPEYQQWEQTNPNRKNVNLSLGIHLRKVMWQPGGQVLSFNRLFVDLKPVHI